MRGTWRKGSFTGGPKRYVKQGSEMGVCFHTDRSFPRAFDIRKYIKTDVNVPCKRVSLSIGAPLGTLEWIRLPGLFETKG